MENNVEKLRLENQRLNEEYTKMQKECLEKFIEWDDFKNAAKSNREKYFINDKYIRKDIEPIIEYTKINKKNFISLDKFKELVLNKKITDDKYYGIYAFDKGKSNIKILPSDIEMGIYRNDFSNIILYEINDIY